MSVTKANTQTLPIVESVENGTQSVENYADRIGTTGSGRSPFTCLTLFNHLHHSHRKRSVALFPSPSSLSSLSSRCSRFSRFKPVNCPPAETATSSCYHTSSSTSSLSPLLLLLSTLFLSLSTFQTTQWSASSKSPSLALAAWELATHATSSRRLLVPSWSPPATQTPMHAPGRQ
jgi:hypothetical protein